MKWLILHCRLEFLELSIDSNAQSDRSLSNTGIASVQDLRYKD